MWEGAAAGWPRHLNGQWEGYGSIDGLRVVFPCGRSSPLRLWPQGLWNIRSDGGFGTGEGGDGHGDTSYCSIAQGYVLPGVNLCIECKYCTIALYSGLMRLKRVAGFFNFFITGKRRGVSVEKTRGKAGFCSFSDNYLYCHKIFNNNNL